MEFDKDVAFLKKHVDTIVLSAKDNDASAAVVPAYQGRVMTSSIDGSESYGWINHKVIESDKVQPHIHVFGGEERFWMGPEGGQFAIFFKKGDSFALKDWQTPAVIDTDHYTVTSKSDTHVSFQKDATISNMSDTEFDIQINRTIKLLNTDQVQQILGSEIGNSVKMVAFESDNKITNMGDHAWTKEGGMLSRAVSLKIVYMAPQYV